jgi:hypothetical protein
MWLGVAQRLRLVVGPTDYLPHRSIRLHPRSLLEATIPKSLNAPTATPPRGHPRIVSWDSAYPSVILLQTNKSDSSDMLLEELASGPSGFKKSGGLERLSVVKIFGPVDRLI